MSYQYKHAAVGGTFDHFHRGHKVLLDEAFAKASLVSIGITDETMHYGKQFPEVLESYSSRRKQVVSYLKEKGAFQRARFHVLHDIYGVADREESLDVLIATEEVRENARKINMKRTQRNLSALDIIIIPLVTGEDGKPINSTRIRTGEIDRNGFSYPSLFDEKDRYFITDELREELRKPLGRIYKSLELGVGSLELEGEEVEESKSQRVEGGEEQSEVENSELGNTEENAMASEVVVDALLPDRQASHEAQRYENLENGDPQIQTLNSQIQTYHFISRRTILFPIEHPPVERLFFGVIPDPCHGSSYRVTRKTSSPYRDLVEYPGMVITVGDVVSMTLRDEGRQADLEVVDFRTRRRKIPEKDIRRYVVDAKPHSNDAGSIHCQTAMDLFRKVSEHLATGEKQQMVITGEEDLLTIPAILLSPLGTKVVYGQVDAGMVVVTVTEEMKRKVAGILKRFRYGVEL